MVLLHGFPFDSRLWDPQFDALGRRFRLIAPDLRGFGNSSGPSDRSGYSIDSFADDALALLDSLEIEQAVLGGLSMGGYTAFELVRRNPERLTGLVLADTRADRDAPEVLERRTAQQKQVEESGGGALVEGMLRVVLSDETRNRRPEVVEALRAIMVQSDAAWIGALEAMKNRADSSTLLGSIRAPTLILAGEHDVLSPPEVARDMHERISDSRLVVIDGAGHISNLESPAAFNSALDRFLGGL